MKQGFCQLPTKNEKYIQLDRWNGQLLATFCETGINTGKTSLRIQQIIRIYFGPSLFASTSCTSVCIQHAVLLTHFHLSTVSQGDTRRVYKLGSSKIQSNLGKFTLCSSAHNSVYIRGKKSTKRRSKQEKKKVLTKANRTKWHHYV